ncbi:MAG: glycosyltransferase family 2 protein [Bacteroidetes bacterium]|nr:glycosyltransferase family 2 protein [Bacteroidota bacterium]
MSPLISICIPVYKNLQYFKILMDSITIQDFRDFEVIVTDDSPEAGIEELLLEYVNLFSVRYTKNTPPKGSPANWNEAIRLAKGQWIKIMHDDDWFADSNSLQRFADAAKENNNCDFIFSGYKNYKGGVCYRTFIPGAAVQRKLNNPLHLIAVNYIGHPSTTLIKNNQQHWFDEKTKWVVDIEFYIRCLQQTNFCAIPEPLINIGMNNEQITQASFRNRSVEIPEYLYLLEKMGEGILNNITVYDHYWRLFRNLGIRNSTALEKYNEHKLIPFKIKKMLAFEGMIPMALLKVGPVSKCCMFISWLIK